MKYLKVILPVILNIKKAKKNSLIQISKENISFNVRINKKIYNYNKYVSQCVSIGVPNRRRNLEFLARFQIRMGEQHLAHVAKRGDRRHERRTGHNESHGCFHHRFDSALAACANRYR